MNLESIKSKLKLIGFFFVGLYSYLHRAFEIYAVSIQAFANFLTILCFKNDVAIICIAHKWNVNASKAITYLTHSLIFVFLYLLLF
jgi:hypothetical protein